RFFEPIIHRRRRQAPDARSLASVVDVVRSARRPLLIAGGGAHYSGAWLELAQFCEKHSVPVAETQAGKGALPRDHDLNVGSIGLTASSASKTLARDAELVLAIGARLSDFTTASKTLFENGGVSLVGLNVRPFDAAKHYSYPLVGD